jgi:hypothetical protein
MAKEPPINSVNFFRMSSAELISSPSVGGASLTTKEALNSRLSKVILISKGKKWTDFLTARDSESPLLCAERVVRALAAEELTGYHVVSVKFVAKIGSGIKPPWPYYWIIPTGASYGCRARYYLGSQRDHRYVFTDESPDEPRGRSGSGGEYVYFKAQREWAGGKSGWFQF